MRLAESLLESTLFDSVEANQIVISFCKQIREMSTKGWLRLRPY